MAAITLRKGGSIGTRKSLAQISTFRHILQSAYDKNPEDHPAPNLLPDDVISEQPEKYWAPHPKTGVFGPPEKSGQIGASAGKLGSSVGSVLELQAWFRTNGDLDIDKNATHPSAVLKEAE